MIYSRREFLGVVSAAGVLAGAKGAAAFSEDDPLGVRRDFPVVNEEGLYLNSPYITPSPRPVVDAGKSFMEAKANNPILLGDMLEETATVRGKFARLIGATEAEVGILDATSAGENLVTRSLDLKAGDNIVIDDLHYNTTFVLYSHLIKTRGIELRIVKSQDGAAPPELFAKHVDNRTRLVSVAWISHRNGYRHDLTGLAKLAHAHNAYLYADAIQGLGMLSLDVKATGVDFLTAGTYKWLLGGFGTAAFYVRESLLDRISPDRMGEMHVEKELPDHQYELFGDGRKYMYATPAFEVIYQLSAALDYLFRVGVENIERHTVALARRLHATLSEQGYPLDTPPGNGSAIVSFRHGKDPGQVRSALEAARIKVSVREEGRQIRLGPALFNNGQDIDRFLAFTGTLM